MGVILDDVAQELYGLPPEEFTEVRNARAKEITAAGDRELAAEVRKLPKPTVAAWLANELARTRGPDVEELIALGPELREAQGNGARQDMRRLVDRRRDVIKELVGAASRRAAEAGHSMASQVQRQLEETLEAAVADEDSAAALGAGRLSNPLAFIGFGGDSTSTQAPPAGGQGAKKAHSEGVQRAGVQRAKKGATSRDDEWAKKRHEAAERALTEAARALSKAQRAMESARVSVEAARLHHSEATARHRVATKELRDADRARAASDQELERALHSCADAEQRLREAANEHKLRQKELNSTSGGKPGARRPN